MGHRVAEGSPPTGLQTAPDFPKPFYLKTIEIFMSPTLPPLPEPYHGILPVAGMTVFINRPPERRVYNGTPAPHSAG